MNITQEPTVLTYVADLEELHYLIVEMKAELSELKTQHDEHFKKLIGVTPEVPTQPELPKVNADEALAPIDDYVRGQRQIAKDFLKESLQDGPVPQIEITEAAANEDISAATLRRAKNELGVTAIKSSFEGGWEWVLPQAQKTKVNGAEKPKAHHQGKLNARKKKPAAVEAAMDYFKKELADGPKNAKKFRAEAHAKHHFRDALKEAEQKLFVISCWIDGEMHYSLPDGPAIPDSSPKAHFRMPAHDPLTYEDLKNGLFSSLCHAYLVGPERSKLANKFRGPGYVVIYSQSLDLFRDGKSIREIRNLQPNAAGDPIGSQGMVRRVVKAIHHFGTPQERAWLFKPNRRVDGLNS